MTWDSSCDFLLTMPFDNLFEVTGRSGLEKYRCKGCQAIVERRERRDHYGRHKGAHTRSQRSAWLRKRQAQLDNLAKAREARRRVLEASRLQVAPEPTPEPEEPQAAPESLTEAVAAVAAWVEHGAETKRADRRMPPPPPPIPARL